VDGGRELQAGFASLGCSLTRVRAWTLGEVFGDPVIGLACAILLQQSITVDIRRDSY
jgi:hypothetical protein